MTLGAWAPLSTPTHVSVGWNREGYVLDSEGVIETVITLSVAQGISGITDFSFDLTVIGNE